MRWSGSCRDLTWEFYSILFPGGALWFNQSDGYAEAGQHIYQIASKMNEDGDYFPLWGTCLGFELLTYLSADGNEHRASCFSQNQPLPLEFKSDFRSSRLFTAASDEVIEILQKEPVTANFHQFCVTEKVPRLLWVFSRYFYFCVNFRTWQTLISTESGVWWAWIAIGMDLNLFRRLSTFGILSMEFR